MKETPDVHLISSLVVLNDLQHTLLVRYDPENEAWWLPGSDLEPFEHPEEAATRITRDLGLEPVSLELAKVDSFRGRRGWHVVFHYRVKTDQPTSTDVPADWFSLENFPKTVHGRWERDTVTAVLAAS